MGMIAVWAALGHTLAGRENPSQPKPADPRWIVERFAAEPDIVTPTGIAVDARGRVLVIENHSHFPMKVKSSGVAERRLKDSIMPEALAANMATQEFRDVIGYLHSPRKEAGGEDDGRAGVTRDTLDTAGRPGRD